MQASTLTTSTLQTDYRNEVERHDPALRWIRERNEARRAYELQREAV